MKELGVWEQISLLVTKKRKEKESYVGLGPNSISNFARKLGLVVYLMDSSVSVDTILVNTVAQKTVSVFPDFNIIAL